MAALTSTLAIALSMVLFVMCVNVIAVMYARGVVRGALDEGARAGARSGAQVAECEQRVAQVLDELRAHVADARAGTSSTKLSRPEVGSPQAPERDAYVPEC